MRTRNGLGLAGLAVLAASLAVGCGKDSDTPDYQTITGRITSIDPKTDMVSMSYYNEKRKQPMEVSGRLAPDAEILINGATARLEDLQVDDRVTVMGRVEKRDGDRQLVANKVEVNREDVPSPKAATQPAEGHPASTRDVP